MTSSAPGTAAPLLDPREEWVLMYRRGLEPEGIARAAKAHASRVRTYLEARVRAAPGVWERRLMRHTQPALPHHVPGSTGEEWEAWRAMLHIFVLDAGRYPQRTPPWDAPGALEQALWRWAGEQRQRHRTGGHTKAQAAALGRIPHWPDGPPAPPGPARPSVLEERWEERVLQCAAFVKEQGHHPMDARPYTDHEATLGRWWRAQRRKLAAGKLTDRQVARLDEVLPGWRSLNWAPPPPPSRRTGPGRWG